MTSVWKINGMEFVKPEYSRQRVNGAGRLLILPTAPAVSTEDYEEALDVIGNWRSSHGYPLQCVRMTLQNRAKQVDGKAIVAQRLKRLSSIEKKLCEHSSWMKLTGMQDIGGCRAIVRNARRVELLVKKYKRAKSKNPTRGHVLAKENDYISDPKPDGYRSYHLIYKYRSTAQKHDIYDDLKIEIQLRSRLQHAWATAVETVETFSGLPLKSRAKEMRGSEKEWRRFFALMGSVIAARERRPPVPNTPPNRAELIEELRGLTKQLNVEATLNAWRASLHYLPGEKAPKAAAFVLVLEPETRKLTYIAYNKEDMSKAPEKVLSLEKERPNTQVVQVSVNSLQALRSAYPNYYLDTTAFLDELRRAIG